MPNTFEQGLELLMDVRRELDLLFPQWEWGWAGESAGTASEFIWQKWEWGPEQLWEPPELSGYLWPPQWPNQPVVTTPLQSLVGARTPLDQSPQQARSPKQILTAVGQLHEIILDAERYLPTAVIPGAPSICKTLDASKKLISALP